ncbi:MAG TPA: endonuclease Q family protein [Candidatus Nanoarchaeia archaeon]|nr:endonuclease Q family protein [Candidatus Nanoarchaeia archaeon]
MNITADLHLHSRFARACSKDITLQNLEKYARMKGISVLGTGDFQHPKWIVELKNQLKDDGKGILRTKTNYPFVLQTEISLIYSQGEKGRRVHNVVLAPNFETADQIIEYLDKKGRLDYDGRPIFNIPCPDFVEDLKKINKEIEIIPAHAWTPWFSVFGSKSGFNSLRECFLDQTKHIRAIETGLSSDPSMNWRVSGLDNVTLISSSDAHSHWPWRIGREATVFSMDELSYSELIKSIGENKIVETLEFYPEEGKYHFDGHRACGICLSPRESLALKKICPQCKTELTIGVANRVEELADAPEGRKPASARAFRNLIPLSEIIAHIIHAPVASKKVWEEYLKLIAAFGNEIAVLSASFDELQKHADERIARAISQVDKVKWKAGYDGEYGIPLFEGVLHEEKNQKAVVVKKPAQRGLGDF